LLFIGGKATAANVVVLTSPMMMAKSSWMICGSLLQTGSQALNSYTLRI
jgi:hypothetical protein